MYACVPRGSVCGSKLPCCSSSTDTGQFLLVHRCTTALENCPPNIEANSQTLSRWASCISDTRSKLMESKIREQQILVAQSAEICAFWVEGFGSSSACTAIKRDFPYRCKRKKGGRECIALPAADPFGLTISSWTSRFKGLQFNEALLKDIFIRAEVTSLQTGNSFVKAVARFMPIRGDAIPFCRLQDSTSIPCIHPFRHHDFVFVIS